MRVVLMALMCAIAISGTAPAQADLSSKIKKVVCKDRLTDLDTTKFTYRVKIIWTQSQSGALGFPQNDGGFDNSEILMGFDTKTGVKDTLLKVKRNYQKPLMCRNGKRFVYSDCGAKKMYLVSWDDSVGTPREIGSGVAGALWYDSSTSKEYVIYSGNCTVRDLSGLFGQCQVIAMNIDSIQEQRVIYNESRTKDVSATWLCISGDAKVLGCIWKWNNTVGSYDISKNPPVIVVEGGGVGCWSTMPYDATYRFVRQDYAHRGWEVIDPKNGSDTLSPVGSQNCNGIRMVSYSTDLFTYSKATSTAAEKAGMLRIVRTDSTLAKIVDTATISNEDEYLDGFGDLWWGITDVQPQAVNPRTFRNAGKLSSVNNLRNLIATGEAQAYTLHGKRLPISSSRTTSGQAGIYIIKQGASCRTIPFLTEIRK